MNTPSPHRPPKLLDQLADLLHQRNYTPAIVRAYVDWVRRFIFFNAKRHPRELGADEVKRFLDYLAGEGQATLFQQAEAGRALRFLYEVQLEKPLPGIVIARGLPEEVPATDAKPQAAPKLLDQMRHVLRVRHYARRTEDSYVDWVKRYIFFNNVRHPAALGAPEVSRFLTHLAVEGHVSASTQSQALNALVFLYKQAPIQKAVGGGQKAVESRAV
jgi:hypothetical protein